MSEFPALIKLKSIPGTYEELKPLEKLMEEEQILPDGKIYSELPSSSHFRLLEILPGLGENIECQLHVCFLAECIGAYEALSYTWTLSGYRWKNYLTMNYEEEMGDYTVSCNGIEKDVQPNLYTALKRLRHRDHSRNIWADALCINQDDMQERSQQVKLMGDIFRNASRVLMWLGSEKSVKRRQKDKFSTPERAFSGVCAVVRTWLKYIHRSESKTLDSLIPSYTKKGFNQEAHQSTAILPDDERWKDILLLYRERWFNRLWVVQEAALAREAFMIWGDCEINWEWVGLAASVMRTNWNRIQPTRQNLVHVGRDNDPESIRHLPSGVMNAYLLYRISASQTLYKALDFSFRDLLVLTKQFDCQDPRDKIFGLLGLAMTDESGSLITPDYSISLSQLYEETALAMLKTSTSLDWLCHVYRQGVPWGYEEGRVFDTSLPSWVPQWGLWSPQSLMPLQSSPSFAAGLSQRTTNETKLSDDRKKLIVRGVIVEKLVGTNIAGDILRKAKEEFPMSRESPEHLNQLLSNQKWTKSCLTELAMTLTAGKSWYGTPITDISAQVADFARCLLGEGLWWALRDDAFNRVWHKDWYTPGSKTPEYILPPPLPTTDEEPVTVGMLEEFANKGNADLFLDAVATACQNRMLFTTDSGLKGMGPARINQGDMLCVINGVGIPFIVRHSSEHNGYILLGECYVHNIMQGEVYARRLEETWIELV